jgi:hypothetical protein
MRRYIALVLLLLPGCGGSTKQDTDAAQKLLHNMNRFAEVTQLEGPEYVSIPSIPTKNPNTVNRPIACVVRIRFVAKVDNRTTRDDWLFWIDSQHQAVDWTSNGQGDKWREYVRSLAKK